MACMRAGACEQVDCRERLGDEVRGAEFEGADACDLIVLDAGDDDHW